MTESARYKIVITGDGKPLDQANPQEWMTWAGPQAAEALPDGRVRILADDSSEQVAQQGWVAVVPDGGGKTVFVTPGLATREAPPE